MKAQYIKNIIQSQKQKQEAEAISRKIATKAVQKS